MNANRRIVAVAAAGAVLMLGPAACATDEKPAPRAAVAGTTAADSRFGGTDIAWIQINIAMDDQVMPLLALTAQRGADAKTQALTSQVLAFTKTELATLHTLNDRAGLSPINPHEGMPMPGMVAPEIVTKAAGLSGAAYDTLFTEQIKAHLDQGVNLATSEKKSGSDPDTVALANQILTTRAQILPTLK